MGVIVEVACFGYAPRSGAVKVSEVALGTRLASSRTVALVAVVRTGLAFRSDGVGVEARRTGENASVVEKIEVVDAASAVISRRARVTGKRTKRTNLGEVLVVSQSGLAPQSHIRELAEVILVAASALSFAIASVAVDWTLLADISLGVGEVADRTKWQAHVIKEIKVGFAGSAVAA